MSIWSFQAMGTTIEVHGDERSCAEAQRMFAAFESRFTRFQTESELSRLNINGEAHVSSDMRAVLDLAAELRSRTQGLFDIAVGRAVNDWGYDRTFSDLIPPETTPDCGHGGWSIDRNRVELEVGTMLDLGGIVKGWVADQVVESGLAKVVSAGGDVRSIDPSLVVEIVDEDGREVTEIDVGIGALATSSTRKRRWMVGDDEAHHLVDPRTQAPAETPIHAASVIAETAAEAEAGAKAVLLLGVEGLAWAAEQPWIRQAIVRWHDGSVYGSTLRRAS